MFEDDDRVTVIVAGLEYYVMPGTAYMIERICADDERGETYTRI